MLLTFLPLLLGGCTGGQEIESSLFVIAMAVDAAPEGNLTITVKALSGSQESAASGASGSQSEAGSTENLEQTETGYIVLSATAPSWLRALGLLGATTPRTVNLSQLQEIVISQTLAETDATLSILKQIHAIYRANDEAVVVVTPDHAGDFIRRQRAVLGLRLSKYLEVLFEHYEQLDVIPPSPNLSAVIAAMESAATDAAADNILLLQGKTDIDRLPGHLPRTAPAPNEYMGAALFSGPRMTGTLTGNEVSLFCLMTGKASTRVSVIDGAQYKTRLQTRVKRRIDPDGTLFVSLRLTLTLSAGNQRRTEEEIAAEIAQDCVNVLQKLQAASCDAVGFGKIRIRAFPDIPAWERLNWPAQYETLPVRVTADVKILQ